MRGCGQEGLRTDRRPLVRPFAGLRLVRVARDSLRDAGRPSWQMYDTATLRHVNDSRPEVGVEHPSLMFHKGALVTRAGMTGQRPTERHVAIDRSVLLT
jgi:hypothetical protein